VHGCQGIKAGKLSVYNYRNLTYNSCKLKKRVHIWKRLSLQLSHVTFLLI